MQGRLSRWAGGREGGRARATGRRFRPAERLDGLEARVVTSAFPNFPNPPYIPPGSLLEARHPAAAAILPPPGEPSFAFLNRHYYGNAGQGEGGKSRGPLRPLDYIRDFQAAPTTLGVSNLRVDSVAFNPRLGRILITYINAGGVDAASATDPANYTLVNPNRPSLGPYQVTQLTIGNPTPIATPSTTLILGPKPGRVNILPTTPAGPVTTQTVTATINGGQGLPHGPYLLTIRSGGVKAADGTPLDGEYVGLFPTGDGRPGGDAQVVLRTNGFLTNNNRPADFLTMRNLSTRTPKQRHNLG